MLLSGALLAALVQASAVLAQKCVPVLPRPTIKAAPYDTGKTHIVSPPRTRRCHVAASGGSDDAPAILAAFKKCNNGGTVVLDGSYTVASQLDLTFLNAVDASISGTITFSADIDYWVANHEFLYTYQNTATMWRFGGKDVNIFGGGVGKIDGNGQAWWDRMTTNSTLLRPILFVVDGLVGGTISGLKMVNSPNWFNLVANSSDIIISDMTIEAKSSSVNQPKNTDGWDTYKTDNLVIQNSVINNGDDCVSFKPNSTSIVIQGLQCNGSHGISVGSLGQYLGEVDIVQDIYVYNISMSNASDGARIKIWPGIQSSFQPLLNGGGGSGWVKNVTYDTLRNSNNDWAIEVTGCYGQSNQTLCDEYPSNMTISNILFENFSGVTSKKYDPKVGTIVCGDASKCSNIRTSNFTVTPPSGKTPTFVCTNVDKSQLVGVNCA